MMRPNYPRHARFSPKVSVQIARHGSPCSASFILSYRSLVAAPDGRNKASFRDIYYGENPDGYYCFRFVAVCHLLLKTKFYP